LALVFQVAGSQHGQIAQGHAACATKDTLKPNNVGLIVNVPLIATLLVDQ